MMDDGKVGKQLISRAIDAISDRREVTIFVDGITKELDAVEIDQLDDIVGIKTVSGREHVVPTSHITRIIIGLALD